ncbi:MAG: diacylglycerol kinase family protein [Clostridia bacterium]|nr:diacylglycerol kinase family protein [Clostridia bacterium]
MITEQCYILYNPHAGSGEGKITAEALSLALGIHSQGLADMTKITNYAAFLSDKQDCALVVCGGDGTLNRFVNETTHLNLPNEIYFLPIGTGNDFLRDIDAIVTKEPIRITDYLKHLPLCEVNGQRYRFINGVGFGIDGYCCEVGDHLKAEGKKDICYTSIAIKGLLFHYKPCGATVTVDGVSHRYEKVWIAPVMHGRYYGGGMMPTPDQKRNNEDGTVSILLFHSTGKLKTLMIFPSLFKGEHLNHPEATEVLTGKEIEVEFDRPSPLQIDGETISNVKKHRILSHSASIELSSKLQTKESEPQAVTE